MPSIPLNAGDILHENTGQSSDASSVSVSIAGALNGVGEAGSGATTAGTKLIIMAHSGSALTTPAGFTLANNPSASGSTNIVYMYWKDVTGAESSWTINVTSGTTAVQWAVWEVQRLATGAPSEGSIVDAYSGVSSPIGTTGAFLSAGNDNFAVGAFGLRATTSQANMSSLALAERTAGGGTPWGRAFDLRWATEGSENFLFTLVRAFAYPTATPAFEATVSGNGSMSSNQANDNWVNAIMAWPSATPSRADCLDHADGFEYGITPNSASPLTSRRLLDILNGTWGTQIAVSSAAPRSGTYHMRVTQAGAAGRAGQDTNTLGTSKDEGVIGAGFKINSSTGTVVLAEIAPASGTILQLVYDTSTTKLGLRWGSGGTPSWQTYTTPTGTYVWVDIVADGFTGATKSAQWAVDGLEEEPPANLTGQATSSLASITYGLNAAQTVTFDVDDWCLSTALGDFPLGPHKVLLLTVDPAGTVTRSGGADANWNVFTANGTLGAYSSANARGAVDEVPPTISASADGVVQVTTGTTTLTFPMDTYTLAPGEVINYVGAIFALWANSAQTANIELNLTRTVGGANFTQLLTTATAFNPGNAAQPASSTVPSWVRGKWADTGNWLQSTLDSAQIQIGNSTDATPDIGIHVGYLIVAVRQTRTARVYGPDEEGLTVDVTMGSNGAVVKYDITAGTKAVTLKYVKRGSEVVQNISASGTLTETISANELAEVSRVTIEQVA